VHTRAQDASRKAVDVYRQITLAERGSARPARAADAPGAQRRADRYRGIQEVSLTRAGRSVQRGTAAPETASPVRRNRVGTAPQARLL
jgi:hypothetical protein